MQHPNPREALYQGWHLKVGTSLTCPRLLEPVIPGRRLGFEPLRPWINADTMSMFLAAVAERHADEFIAMVMHQAGWHVAGGLQVPSNMRLVFLPPYSHELNPAEHLWEALTCPRNFGPVVT